MFDAATVHVYQAFPRDIALPAVEHQQFVDPFKRDRMTGVKPSFLWTMYRSGWATKPGQERVLAVSMRREGFDAALAMATLSGFDPSVHTSQNQWRSALAASPVRVQWDPERSLTLEPLPGRTIQMGLAGDAVRQYVDAWVTGIADITDTVRAIHALVRARRIADAEALLPVERPYPVAAETAPRIGVSSGKVHVDDD